MSKSEVITGDNQDKNFKYANAAIHCSNCGGIYEIDDPSFKEIQTGMMITANADSRLSLGCPKCKHVLSLVFVQAAEPKISDAEIVSEVIETKNEMDNKE